MTIGNREVRGEMIFKLKWKQRSSRWKHRILQVGVLIFAVVSARGQGAFQNLNFEAANNLPSLSGSQTAFVAVSNAFPGWTIYQGLEGGTGPSSQVFYGGISAGGAIVTLISKSSFYSNEVIFGNYTAVVSGGEGDQVNSAPSAIAQTGMIPINSRSLFFFGSFNIAGYLAVTFNGQALQYVPYTPFQNAEIYAADISQFAGQTGELRFTETPTANNHNPSAIIDQISFSPTVTPEPTTWSLVGLGAGMGVLKLKIKKVKLKK